MTNYKYDLHIHSCLSPCADDDMTPGNIAGMAAINGLGIVALTDHNSCKNCPAFFAHAKRCGIVPIAGMEITTSEDIHMICLFPGLEDAMRFDAVVYEKLIKVKNKPKIFGRQLIMDESDEIAGEEEFLLINATTLDADDAERLCREFGGVCYPAHVDRQSNGMIAVLGDIPPEIPFTAFELRDGNNLTEYREKYPALRDKNFVVSSDAHNLWSISEGGEGIDLDDEPYSSALVRKRFFEYLRRKE